MHTISKVVWIDDDFLSDESIQFDFKAFEIIENKIIYLNPKHFSVLQLINALRHY